MLCHAMIDVSNRHRSACPSAHPTCIPNSELSRASVRSRAQVDAVADMLENQGVAGGWRGTGERGAGGRGMGLVELDHPAAGARAPRSARARSSAGAPNHSVSPDQAFSQSLPNTSTAATAHLVTPIVVPTFVLTLCHRCALFASQTLFVEMGTLVSFIAPPECVAAGFNGTPAQSRQHYRPVPPLLHRLHSILMLQHACFLNPPFAPPSILWHFTSAA